MNGERERERERQTDRQTNGVIGLYMYTGEDFDGL